VGCSRGRTWTGRLPVCTQRREEDRPSRAREAAKARLANAEAALRRFQAAIAAGIDPGAIVDAINEAQAQRVAARAELDGLPSASRVTRAELYARLDSLGDVGKALSNGSPEKVSVLYHDLGVELRFDPVERAVDATASPRVVTVAAAATPLAVVLEVQGDRATAGRTCRRDDSGDTSLDERADGLTTCAHAAGRHVSSGDVINQPVDHRPELVDARPDVVDGVRGVQPVLVSPFPDGQQGTVPQQIGSGMIR
jgi:hypothetical protein